MSCGCEAPSGQSPAERRVLTIALALNAAMFVVGLIAGLIAQSTGLIADSLDMLSDASAYGIALVAMHHSAAFKAGAARLSGGILIVLGLGVLIDVVRRGLGGSEPASWIMLATATASLIVNSALARRESRGLHYSEDYPGTLPKALPTVLAPKRK